MGKHIVKIFQHNITINDEDTWVELEELELRPETARELAELGIAEIHQGKIPSYQIVRIQKMLRLHENLEVNLVGAAIILDLLEQMEKLKAEIKRLKGF